MTTTAQRAGLVRRAAATLSGRPVEGSCDDTCGCAADTVGPSGRASVPLATSVTTDAVADAEDVAIACTLGAGEMSTRIDDWAAALGGVTARRALDDGLRLELGPDTDIAEVVRLAVAEQGCCRFFSFALVIDARCTALEVHAAPGGQPVLTDLFGAGTYVATSNSKAGLGVVGAGAVACAVCCAAPIAGFLAATGIASVLGVVAFGVVGLLVVLVVAGVVWQRRRRQQHQQACAPTTAVPVDAPRLETRR